MRIRSIKIYILGVFLSAILSCNETDSTSFVQDPEALEVFENAKQEMDESVRFEIDQLRLQLEGYFNDVNRNLASDSCVEINGCANLFFFTSLTIDKAMEYEELQCLVNEGKQNLIDLQKREFPKLRKKRCASLTEATGWLEMVMTNEEEREASLISKYFSNEEECVDHYLNGIGNGMYLEFRFKTLHYRSSMNAEPTVSYHPTLLGDEQLATHLYEDLTPDQEWYQEKGARNH